MLADVDVSSAELEATIYKAGGFLLKNVELFDLYSGENIEAGKKSLAWHLTFQSPNKTLTDKDTGKLRKKITGALRAKHNALLRDS